MHRYIGRTKEGNVWSYNRGEQPGLQGAGSVQSAFEMLRLPGSTPAADAEPSRPPFEMLPLPGSPAQLAEACNAEEEGDPIAAAAAEAAERLAQERWDVLKFNGAQKERSAAAAAPTATPDARRQLVDEAIAARQHHLSLYNPAQMEREAAAAAAEREAIAAVHDFNAAQVERATTAAAASPAERMVIEAATIAARERLRRRFPTLVPPRAPWATAVAPPAAQQPVAGTSSSSGACSSAMMLAAQLPETRTQEPPAPTVETDWGDEDEEGAA